MSFYSTRKIQGSFDDTLNRLKNLLHSHAYLIAVEIDVQGALKERLGADLPKIYIIGTNTPKVGYQLFRTDPRLGILLPFSIVLQETGTNEIEITMIDPEWLFRFVEDPSINALAHEVKDVFDKVLNAL